MVTFEQYLKGVLKQVDDSYTLLENLRDKPGDLEIIRREIAKVTGLFSALVSKLETNKEDSEYQHILSPMYSYLENNDFFREMDTMSQLYADDPMRLKNLRLSIIGSLDEKNLMAHIKSIIRE